MAFVTRSTVPLTPLCKHWFVEAQRPRLTVVSLTASPLWSALFWGVCPEERWLHRPPPAERCTQTVHRAGVGASGEGAGLICRALGRKVPAER